MAGKLLESYHAAVERTTKLLIEVQEMVYDGYIYHFDMKAKMLEREEELKLENFQFLANLFER